MKRQHMEEHILHWLEGLDDQKHQLVIRVIYSSVDYKGKKVENVLDTVELLSEGQFIEVAVYEGCTGKRKYHYRLQDEKNLFVVLEQYLDKQTECKP